MNSDLLCALILVVTAEPHRRVVIIDLPLVRVWSERQISPTEIIDASIDTDFSEFFHDSSSVD